jgi:hypothetical protein
MERTVDTSISMIDTPDFQQAWDLVVSQLRMDMPKGLFETWVLPLAPIDFSNHVFKVGAKNPYARDWVESRLKDRVLRILEGVYNEPVSLKVDVVNGLYRPENLNPEPAPILDFQIENKRQKTAVSPSNSDHTEPIRNRKVMLQRAYGSKRASIIQPERGMFVTMYFFNNWLPLVGHSALTIIMAARSMCFWNPMTGELRNTVDTDMTDLANRASVSVRTVKEVLKNDLVRKYFLRYRARRIMTPNGIRTAGITIQVRMDDPLTPQDQIDHDLPEEERWYSDEYNDNEED